MGRRCLFEVTGRKLRYNIALICICSCVVRDLWAFLSSGEYTYGLGFAADPTVEGWAIVFFIAIRCWNCAIRPSLCSRRRRCKLLLCTSGSASIIVGFADILRSGM